MLANLTLISTYPVLGDELPWEKKKRPCDRSPDERFEDEIVRGGCREEFIRILTAKIQEAFKMFPDIGGGIREMVRDFVTDNLSKFITDNVSGGNIAEFLTLCAHVATSCACFAAERYFAICNIIATQFKRLVRKIIFETLKIICRMSGCCIPGPDAECCGWVNGTKVALKPLGPRDPMTEIFEEFSGAFLNIFSPFTAVATAFNPFSAFKRAGVGKSSFLNPFGAGGGKNNGGSSSGGFPNPFGGFGGGGGNGGGEQSSDNNANAESNSNSNAESRSNADSNSNGNANGDSNAEGSGSGSFSSFNPFGKK